MCHTEDKKAGCTEGEAHSEIRVNVPSAECGTGIVLELQNGDFSFGVHGRKWISGPGNVPEIQGKTRISPAVGKRVQLEGMRKSITSVIGYAGADEDAEICRTLEYCPGSGSFTIQDEPTGVQGETAITEILRFDQPVRLQDGMAVTETEGRRITVFVRNQENLRVENSCRPESEQQEKSYVLKWELKKGCAYTCCQIEIRDL